MSEQNTPNGTADLFKKAWRGFQGAKWTDEVNVREFIQNNYTQYDGNEDFLAAPTEATDKLWGRLQELQKEERKKGGVLECETEIVSSLTSYGPGYIDESLKDLETIVGLQTDKPLKRAFMPYGADVKKCSDRRNDDICCIRSDISDGSHECDKVRNKNRRNVT